MALESLIAELREYQYILVIKRETGLDAYSSYFTESQKDAVISILLEREDKPSSITALTIPIPALKNIKSINFGTNQVLPHYQKAMTSLSQLVCKAVAKIWIKVAEPNKQANHPYKYSNESKPAWWPSGVDHIEPDHLDKHGRMELMISILRNDSISIEEMRARTNVMDVKPLGVKTVVDKILFELYYFARFDRLHKRGQLAEADIIVSNFDVGKNGYRAIMLSKIGLPDLNYIEYPLGTHIDTHHPPSKIRKRNRKSRSDPPDQKACFQDESVMYDPFLIYIEGYTSSSESTEF